MSLHRRVAPLEGQWRKPAPQPFVFESIEAAARAGAAGGVLIIGSTMGVAEWCEATRVQQAELTREEHAKT